MQGCYFLPLQRMGNFPSLFLILFSQLRMLARGLIISRRFVQVRTDLSTGPPTYQIIKEANKNQTIMMKVTSQMKFSCTLKNALLIIRDRFGLSFATKGLGYLVALYLPFRYLLVPNYLAIKLLVTYYFSACRKYLAENHFSFPFAPGWVRDSYLSKGLRLIPYTCGSSRLLFGAVARE